jgi:hypothetical protein
MHELLTLPQVARNLRGFARPAWIASCFYVTGLVHVALNLTYNIRQDPTTSLIKLSLTNTSPSALKRTHETFLYLGGLATLAATVSVEPLYTHAMAGGSHTGFKRLLIALVLSNAALASCCLGTALTVYAHSMSNATISDQIYQPLLLVSELYILASTLTSIGLRINPASLPFCLLHRPSSDPAKGFDEVGQRSR